MLKKILNNFRKTPTAYPEQSSALMDTFARLPVCFVRGEGSSLFDDKGSQYLDALGGLAVTILGHSHPRISEAISLQASKLLHTSNLFQIKEQSQLAEKFCQIAQMDKVFFANSGAEANEAAIKLARLHGHKRGVKSPAIITTHASFHGRTMATLSATGNPSLHKNFTPLLSDFIHVDYNDLEAISALSDNTNVVAVMIEPIQGEAGIKIPDAGYLKSLRALCDENDWLLIIDEIQTGMGRTGKWFAYQHEEVIPDVMTSAKGLANGIPIGACAATGAAANVFTKGTHGSTFGGNPFSCQVALTTIDIIEQDGLLSDASSTGLYLKKQIQQHIGTHDKVHDIRGIGMMLAVELDKSYNSLAEKFLDAGLVINVTGGGKIIRLLPAINLTENEAKKIAQIIHDVIITL